MEARNIVVSTVPELHADAGSAIASRAVEGRAQQRDWVRWAFLLPTVLLLFVITIYPMLNSLWNSLHYFNLFTPDEKRFVGLGNYVDLLRNDPTFWAVMRITFIYTIGVVAIQFIAGLGMALLLDRAMRGISILRTLIIIPILISPVVVGLTWRYMYEPWGVLNYVLGKFGIPPIEWVSSPSYALISIMVVDIWQWTPFVVLVLLAGLQSIPREVVEAAALDGLKFRQYFTRILWPLLRPVALIVLLIRMMDALKVFDTVYMLTRGGPGTSTYVASMYNYVLFFGNYQVGYAAAMSYIILIIVNVFAIALIFTLSEREAKEEEAVEEAFKEGRLATGDASAATA
jgi:multiple sugar transport system permease protein